MDVPKPLSMHLNTFRSLTEEKKIPDIAIHSFYKSFVAPHVRSFILVANCECMTSTHACRSHTPGDRGL